MERGPMMGSVNFTITDNAHEVLSELHLACNRALERCGSLAASYARMLCPVDTGALRNSIGHDVATLEKAVYIGTNQEYGVYVEMGTGKYVSGGRPTPWAYQDAQGRWHMTHGQRAQPYIKPAVADHIGTYQNIIKDAMKSG